MAAVPSKQQVVSIDEMLPFVGEFGRFQKTIVGIMFMTYFVMAFQVLIVYFSTVIPSWECNANSTQCLFNGTFPSEDRRRCNMLRHEWTYTEKSNQFSIATQFDIKCDEEWKLQLVSAAFFVGWGIGAFVYGWMGDKFGRKILVAPSVAGILVFAFTSSFMPNIYMVIACRFIIGFFVLGPIVQLGTLVMELVGPKHRPVSGLIPMLAFPLAYTLLALKAYLLKNWKLLSIVCTAPYVWLLVLYAIVPESVRWLQLQGRHDEVMQTFRKMAKFNGRTFPTNITVARLDFTAKGSKPSGSLFQSRKMTLQTFACALLWLTSSMTFYSLQLAANDLGGNLYTDFICLSIIQFPGVLINLFMSNKMGRKIANLAPLLVSGLACVGVGFIPTVGIYKWVRVGVGMFGKCMATATFEGISVWSNEIFPTSVRSKGIGLVQVAARIGASSAPFIGKGLKQYGAPIPFIVMGIPAIVASITGLYLPETKDRQMIDSVDDNGDIEMGVVGGDTDINSNNVITNNSIDTTILVDRVDNGSVEMGADAEATKQYDNVIYNKSSDMRPIVEDKNEHSVGQFRTNSDSSESDRSETDSAIVLTSESSEASAVSRLNEKEKGTSSDGTNSDTDSAVIMTNELSETDVANKRMRSAVTW